MNTQQQIDELRQLATGAVAVMKLAVLQALFNYVQAELIRLRNKYLPEEDHHV